MKKRCSGKKKKKGGQSAIIKAKLGCQFTSSRQIQRQKEVGNPACKINALCLRSARVTMWSRRSLTTGVAPSGDRGACLPTSGGTCVRPRLCVDVRFSVLVCVDFIEWADPRPDPSPTSPPEFSAASASSIHRLHPSLLPASFPLAFSVNFLAVEFLSIHLLFP